MKTIPKTCRACGKPLVRHTHEETLYNGKTTAGEFYACHDASHWLTSSDRPVYNPPTTDKDD